MDTIIRNGKLVIPKVGIVDGDIAIENGKIAAILSPNGPLKQNCSCTKVAISILRLIPHTTTVLFF